MIDAPLERLTQVMKQLDDVFVPAGLLRSDDVRAVLTEARRLSERMKVLERALALEVGQREATRQRVEQASPAFPNELLVELISSYDRR